MTIGKVKFSQLPAQVESELDPSTILAVVNLGVSKKTTLTNVKNYLITDGLATKAYVDNAITMLVDGAPDILNTLNELADALNNDQNFYATITDLINTTASGLFPSKTTDDLAEGINNLYFTQDRSRNSITVTDPSDTLTYDPFTGVFTFNISGGALVTSVNGFAGDVMLYTEHVPESVNLYFTEERARASLSGNNSVIYDNVTGVIDLIQPIGPTDSVVFANLEITNESTFGGDVYIEGDVVTPLHVIDETDSTDKDSGAFIVEGGAGIEKNLNVGGDLNVGGTLTAASLSVEGITVEGEFSHEGLVPTEGTNIDQIKTYSVYLRLLTDWQDTGISNISLETGTYIVQLYANDTGSGGTNNNEYYSGIMSWYQSSTDSSQISPTDEIPLHRAGGSGDGNLYLRTFRTPAGDPANLKLQIYSNIEAASAANYVFKFRRVI